MISTCHCCGLAHRLPAIEVGQRAVCVRCETTLNHARGGSRSSSRTAALASAALILYPLAVLLPVIRVEKLGHTSESSVAEGVMHLLADGELAVGLILLICSVVFPLFKLVSLLLLSMGGRFMRDHHRALTYRMVEWTGRWGMLDVLCVALLVAVLKLGDIVEVSVGPGALAFAGCVILSLLSSASFNPHRLWEPQQ